MEEKEKKTDKINNIKNTTNHKKKQKHQHPNDQTTKTTTPAPPKPSPPSSSSSSDFSFKPSSDVKGIRFGGQFIVKSFTIRRARPLELLQLLSFPPTKHNKIPFPSTVAFLPTNFTILAHHAWHTLTLGLGTKKSKVLIFVFESEAMRSATVDRLWPSEIPLGEVNKRFIRGLKGCEMARFKFRKGCLTFYVYAVRKVGSFGFSCVEDLRTILQTVVALKDFLDHTAMLALPNQRSINYSCPPPVAMAH